MAFASKIITCLLILTIYIAAPTESHITCGTVTSTMTQCISYLTNGGPLPSSCCVAVKSLNQMAQTTPDRRQVCECLKSAGKEIKGLNIDLVAALPTTCGVSLSYPIGFNTNCDRQLSIYNFVFGFILDLFAFFFQIIEITFTAFSTENILKASSRSTRLQNI